MFNPLDHPFLILLATLSFFSLASWIGAWFHKKAASEDIHDDFTFVIGGTLTLLALILSFTFSMAVSRYDQRKNYEEEEANAIGTEYNRADQLSAGDATKVRALLKAYTNQRIHFYVTSDKNEAQRIDARTVQLQSEMWALTSTSVASLPAPMATFVLGGMNDVLNTQGYTQAAWWNRIPLAAWMLLITISLFCNLLVGYAAHRRSILLLLVLPIALSISLFLIADIDSPHGGAIRVRPQNLERLAESLR
jgi:hypothetical protein